MADQADVPLSMEVRGGYSQGVACACARSQSGDESRDAGEDVRIHCGAADRTLARGWIERRDDPCNRGELPAIARVARFASRGWASISDGCAARCERLRVVRAV